MQQIDESARRLIVAWLTLCCAMIFAMVILGGVTRLTGSGLSMVEWDPLFGVVPPLSEQAWQEVFEKYQASPEYRQVNIGMDLEGFKSIYWFEFAHRILGRSIGIVFLLPLLYFLFRGMLERPLLWKLSFAFVLGGLQGLLGWYMVKSGLVDRPHVSQYRLTAHLSLALLIYGYLLWILFGLLRLPRDDAPPRGLAKPAAALLALLALTIVSGGFVAGMKAGLAYNTFPKMGDHWMPPGAWMLEPGWLNLFENIVTIQFNHRLLALLTLLSVAGFWLYARRRAAAGVTRNAVHALLLFVLVQVSLGISTLLLHVPVSLGAAHQAGALTLLTVALFVNHRVRRGADYRPE